MPELVMLPNNLHDPHSLHRVALADSRPTWLSLINCWLGSPSLINDPPYLTMNIRTLSNNPRLFSALLILWCDALPHNINRFGNFTRVRYVVWMPPSRWYNIDNDDERDSWDVPAPVVKAWGNSEWQSKSKETSRQDPRLSSKWASPSRVPPPIDDASMTSYQNWKKFHLTHFTRGHSQPHAILLQGTTHCNALMSYIIQAHIASSASIFPHSPWRLLLQLLQSRLQLRSWHENRTWSSPAWISERESILLLVSLSALNGAFYPASSTVTHNLTP